MTKILTLCPGCAQLLETGYRLSKVPTETTTQKRKQCEQCRQKFPEDILSQYILTSRRK